MYLLLPLALIAVLLLIDPPTMPTREHLSPTSTIRPSGGRDDAELDRRGAMVPEPMKTELASKRPGLSKDRAAGLGAGELILDPAYQDWYAPATSPLTEASLDSYIAELKAKLQTASPFPRYTDTMLVWIANGNIRSLLKSYFIDQQTPTTSTPPSDTPKTLEELKTDYDAKSKEYKTLIDEAVASGSTQTMDKIRKLNVELASLLERMISTVSPGQSKRSIESARDELVGRLRRIQMDYNGLLQTTDELETLRRIRAQEEGGFLRVFYWHLIALGVLFVGVLGAMLYMRRQTSTETTASPTTSADLA